MAGTSQPPPKRLRRDVWARALEDSAAERSARRVVYHGDGLLVRDADGRCLSATADHNESPEEGTAQPAPKRLRRAPEDAAAEQRARLVVDHGDSLLVSDAYGRCVSATVGARHHDEPPEAEALLGGQPQLRRIPLWTGCGDDGVLGAAVDIFLVQPRKQGVPPSTLQTIRGAGIGYWISQWIATRLGTPLEMPQSWSWESVMGQPAYGRGGVCTICAIATCLRARHCVEFERRHGAGTFPYQLSDLQYLIEACRAAGVWVPVRGAAASAVLELMSDQGLWVRTRDVEGWQRCLLRFKSFGIIPADDSAHGHGRVGVEIRLRGPIVGALHAGADYGRTSYDDRYVYRGSSGKPNHAVVCMAYRFTPGREMHLRVMDNVTCHGPLRWILYEAFTRFFYIDVDPLDRAELQLNYTSVARWLIRKLLLFWRRR